MAKLIKNSFGNFGIIFLVFILIFGWLFSGWPRIWQKPPAPLDIYLMGDIPPEIKEALILLSTTLLLTAISVFAIFKAVNPPRAVFGPCGVFILC